MLSNSLKYQRLTYLSQDSSSSLIIMLRTGSDSSQQWGHRTRDQVSTLHWPHWPQLSTSASLMTVQPPAGADIQNITLYHDLVLGGSGVYIWDWCIFGWDMSWSGHRLLVLCWGSHNTLNTADTLTHSSHAPLQSHNQKTQPMPISDYS